MSTRDFSKTIKNYGINVVLKNKRISCVEGTNEWKRRLHDAEDFKTILSLLHFGLDDDMNWDFETLSIYLDYAYGYQDISSFGSSSNADLVFDVCYDGKIKSVNTRDLKQLVAKKAFSVLCLKFFKDTEKENLFQAPAFLGSRPSWWGPLMQSDEIFQKIIDFFVFEKNIPRLTDPSNIAQIALDFIYKVAIFGWKVYFREEDGFELKPPQILVENRNKLILLLKNIKKLNYFFFPCMDRIALEDLYYIKSLAFNVEYNGRKLSSQEAFVHGFDIAILHNALCERIVVYGEAPPSRKELLDSLFP